MHLFFHFKILEGKFHWYNLMTDVEELSVHDGSRWAVRILAAVYLPGRRIPSYCEREKEKEKESMVRNELIGLSINIKRYQKRFCSTNHVLSRSYSTGNSDRPNVEKSP